MKFKHGVYSNKNKNNTSMHELTLELKNKSKTQANQTKKFHKLLVISRAHGKKMTLRK